MNDLISRQAAIDAIEKMNIPEDMCVFEILSHIEVEIATLPPAQPEVIRCKDCKYYKTKFCALDTWTNEITIYNAQPDDFCSRAKRRGENDG